MNNYNLGNGGVNIVKNPTQLADNEMTLAQNAEYHPDQGVGGEGAITKRGGLLKLFAGGLGGAILGMVGTGLDALALVATAITWYPASDISAVSTGNMSRTVSVVGGGMTANWEPTADNTDTSYLRVHYPIQAGVNGGTEDITLGLDPIADPGHDDNYTFKVRVRRNVIGSGNISVASFGFFLRGATGGLNKSILLSTATLTTDAGAFTDHSVALTEANVQALRADDGFANGRVLIETQLTLTVVPGNLTETFDFDVARVWIDIQPHT